MAKRKTKITLHSFGIYTPFERDDENLPQILSHTTKIPAELDIEFGYILKIEKAKGSLLRFEIDHPPFPGEDGKIAKPFTGEEYVRTNTWHFFLGDTLWQPVEDKVGPWTLTTWLDDEQIAKKTFDIGNHDTKSIVIQL